MGDKAMADNAAAHGIEELTATSNPYLDFYREFHAKSDGKDLIRVFDPDVPEKTRAKLYKELDVAVAMKYSWAIPDERALRIIKHYGPIVEMGAGTGYWGRLLQLRGVDIVCYDLHTADDDEENDKEQEENAEESDEADEEQEEDDGEPGAQEGDDEEEQDDGEDDEEEAGSEDAEEEEEEEVEVEQIYWMDVLKGTPKDLRKHSDRALFLCYPDDFEDSEESMALQSLCNYSGDTVIHVGELLGQTLCLPGPWGRTSSQEFQVHLASVYHKVLQVPLPSWHSSIDTLTVWKRTKTSIMDNSIYAFIPTHERLDLIEACPSTRFLLEEESKEASKATKKQKAESAVATVDSGSSKSSKRRKKQT